jgi:hypothetical protein
MERKKGDKEIHREIRKVYIKHLHREPDERRLCDYTKRIRNGMTFRQLSQHIQKSSECKTNSSILHKPVEYITPECKLSQQTNDSSREVTQHLHTQLHDVKPMLTSNDLKLFDKYLDNPSNSIKKYFEFGSGNSTIYTANKLTVAKVYSVENDKQWHRRIINVHHKKIEIQYANTDSPNNSYGKPTKIDKRKFANYYRGYKVSYNCNIIMIDGRFRVSCALDIFNKINENVIVLFDDFVNRTSKYDCVLKYFNVVEKGERMIVLCRKSTTEIDRKELESDKVKYSTITD